MSWIGRISKNRTQALGHQGPAAADAKKAVADPKVFTDTLISDKVLKRHGADLAPAAGDMQAIAAAGRHLATHRAAQFTNAVDQFYSALGRSTDHLADPTKRDTITASAAAMRDLVLTLAHSDHLMPAMAAISSLLEPRATVDVAPRAHAEAAKQAVLDLVGGLDGREGASSMLFGFRNLVEAYESSQDGLTAKGRPAVWRAVQGYLDAVVPRVGCDQGELGRVAGLFHRALRETPEDPQGALARAQTAALEPMVAPREAAKQQLEQPIAGLAEGTPGAEAWGALKAALRSVLDDNPAGPAELVAAVEAFAGAVQGHLPNLDADRAAGMASIAQIVRIAGATPAARTVLEHLAAHGPQLANHPQARGVLSRAARIQKPESLAPVLLESYAVYAGRDPAQAGIGAAIDKLKRLPPGPALNATLALLGHLGNASAPALAEALFVEARLTETPDALKSFVSRFMAAHPTLQPRLGDDALPAAVALARSNGNVDAQRANRLANLAANVKGLVPETPITKLIEPGKGGEAGLLQLAEAQTYLHDPSPLLFDLLRAANEAKGGRDATAESRLAMHIAAQLGQLDRDPRGTDFPRILEDFKGALADPKTLTYAAGGGAAQVKGPRTVAGFLDAHAALPPELAFTAGRALTAAQLGWVTHTIDSSRSRAFGRSVRDAVFAAVKMDRLDLVDALMRPDVDSKIMQAAVESVALQHRQNQADQIPFDRLVEGLNKGEDPIALIEAEKAKQALAGLKLEGLERVDPEGMAHIQDAMKEVQSMLGFFDRAQYGMPAEHFLTPLQAVVKGQADGSLKHFKYASDVAKEHLQGLSQEQVQAWMRDEVTSAGAPAPVADDPEAQEAMTLLAGIAKTLHREVDIKGKGFEDVGWSKASLETLTRRRDELVGKLREAKKGSPAHRKLSGEIGPVQSRVALLELHLTLKETFAEAPGAAQAVLSKVAPLAHAALPTLRKMRQSGFVQALDSAIAANKPPPANSRQGRHALDEDQVEAYLTSFNGGSCLNPVSGFNRGSLVEFMAGSQYKMLRAMNGNESVGRGLLRLVRVKLPNGYEGHAISVDVPKGTKNYAKPPQADCDVMYEHALKKATAMGIPLVTQGNDAAGVAQKAGLQIENMQTEVRLHRGVTGMHQSEGLGEYWINWPGITGHGGTPKEGDAYAVRNYNRQVIMPANWKK